MPSRREFLYSIKESSDLTSDLWNQFAARAIAEHGTIAAALAVLFRQYLDRPAAPGDAPPRLGGPAGTGSATSSTHSR
jgi:hypothetical protein